MPSTRDTTPKPSVPERIAKALSPELRALARSGFTPKAVRSTVPFWFTYSSNTALGMFSISLHGGEYVVQASFRAETTTQTPHLGGAITFVEVVNLPGSIKRQAFKRLDGLVAYCRRLIPYLLRAVMLSQKLAAF